MGAPKPLSEGFSPDGYIRDQDCFSSVRYRSMPASINGCGWIAAFDLLHFLFREEDWDSVRSALDEGHRVRMPGPTLLPVMRRYLLSRIPELQELRGREEALAVAPPQPGRHLPLSGGEDAPFRILLPHRRGLPLLQRRGRSGGRGDAHGALR